MAEGKPARRVIELHRRDAEVGEHAAHGLDVRLPQNFNELLVASLNERHPVSESPQPLARSFERSRIAVDCDQARRRVPLQQPLGVPAQPDRRIDERPVAARGAEEFDHFVEKNRLVHGYTPCNSNSL